MSAVAENYADALFSLAQASGQLEEYGRWIEGVARAVESSPETQATLVSPRVTKAFKAGLVGSAAAGAGAPDEFVRYLGAIGRRGRHGSLGAIAAAYGALLDKHFNRVRAAVTMARTPDAALQSAITESLARAIGKSVVSTFTVEPELLGGAVVRVGDRIYDGSLRRRLVRLRQQLLSH